MKRNLWLWALLLAAATASSALAGDVTFKDPIGDDNGPGKYTYPTDQVYKPGSFDLTFLKVKDSANKVTFDVGVNANVENPWNMQSGFSVQMVFIFIQTDPKTPGFTKGLPGLNIEFEPDSGWQKCVIISPQPPSRVKQEVETKVAKDLQAGVIVPKRVNASGRTLSVTIDKTELGGGDPATWGYQVIMQSNEGFPAPTDLLVRKVNEYEGQHRFGGGTDTDCDPNVMDILAGNGVGDPSEVESQHQMLSYECNPDGAAKKMATLKLVHKK